MGKGAKKDKKCKKKDKRSSVQSRGTQLPLTCNPAPLMASIVHLQQQQAASSSSSVVKAFIEVKLERLQSVVKALIEKIDHVSISDWHPKDLCRTIWSQTQSY